MVNGDEISANVNLAPAPERTARTESAATEIAQVMEEMDRAVERGLAENRPGAMTEEAAADALGKTRKTEGWLEADVNPATRTQMLDVEKQTAAKIEGIKMETEAKLVPFFVVPAAEAPVQATVNVELPHVQAAKPADIPAAPPEAVIDAPASAKEAAPRVSDAAPETESAAESKDANLEGAIDEQVNQVKEMTEGLEEAKTELSDLQRLSAGDPELAKVLSGLVEEATHVGWLLNKTGEKMIEASVLEGEEFNRAAEDAMKRAAEAVAESKRDIRKSREHLVAAEGRVPATIEAQKSLGNAKALLEKISAEEKKASASPVPEKVPEAPAAPEAKAKPGESPEAREKVKALLPALDGLVAVYKRQGMAASAAEIKSLKHLTKQLETLEEGNAHKEDLSRFLSALLSTFEEVDPKKAEALLKEFDGEYAKWKDEEGYEKNFFANTSPEEAAAVDAGWEEKPRVEAPAPVRAPEAKAEVTERPIQIEENYAEMLSPKGRELEGKFERSLRSGNVSEMKKMLVDFEMVFIGAIKQKEKELKKFKDKAEKNPLNAAKLKVIELQVSTLKKRLELRHNQVLLQEEEAKQRETDTDVQALQKEAKVFEDRLAKDGNDEEAKEGLKKAQDGIKSRQEAGLKATPAITGLRLVCAELSESLDRTAAEHAQAVSAAFLLEKAKKEKKLDFGNDYGQESNGGGGGSGGAAEASGKELLVGGEGETYGWLFSSDGTTIDKAIDIMSHVTHDPLEALDKSMEWAGKSLEAWLLEDKKKGGK